MQNNADFIEHSRQNRNNSKFKKNKNLKIIFILLVTLVYFLLAIFFIYTADSSGEEEMYFVKVKEVYQNKFSLSWLDAYDFGLLNLIFPLKLIYLKFASAVIAFLGIIFLILALYKNRGPYEGPYKGLLLGLLIVLNPTTIYYFITNQKWSLLFLSLALFLFIYLDKGLKKSLKNILGIIILLYLALIETSFCLILSGFLLFLLFSKFKINFSKPEVKIKPFFLLVLIFLVLLFSSFRVLNRDLFIESEVPLYLAQYFAAILLFLLIIFSGKARGRRNFLLFILITFTLIEFFIPAFKEHSLFKTAFLPLVAFFAALNIGKLITPKSKKIILSMIIILLILSPLAHKIVGGNLLNYEENPHSPIKSFSELGELVKVKAGKNALIFSIYPSFAPEADGKNLPEIKKCHTDLNYKKRCGEKDQVEVLENYLLQNKKIDAIIFLEEDIVDYPETRQKIEEKYELSAVLELHIRKMDKALIYLLK